MSMDINSEKRPTDTTTSKVKLPSRFTFDVPKVMDHFHSAIFGQKHVLDHVESMLRLVKADIGDPSQPLYVGIYLGPTGVGKTETVRTLAKAIYGSPDNYCRIDMNTLSQEHYAAALTGAPPGYVGSKEGTSLFQKDVIEGSFSKPGIVLFDEIEKANAQVTQTLLGVLDNGTLALSSGSEVIDFRNSIIIMTSNIGSNQIQQFSNHSLRTLLYRLWYKKSPAHWNLKEDALLKQIVQTNLEREFTPEFINRMDDIIIFEWLKKGSIDNIVHLMVDQLKLRLEKKSIALHVTSDVRDLLISKSYDKKYGARQVKRVVRKHLELPIVTALESEKSSKTVQGLTIQIEERSISVKMNREKK